MQYSLELVFDRLVKFPISGQRREDLRAIEQNQIGIAFIEPLEEIVVPLGVASQQAAGKIEILELGYDVSSCLLLGMTQSKGKSRYCDPMVPGGHPRSGFSISR